uniref:Uncharacterized protein n=1 Tax=Chromera velia CCMP2878 TaxID=1169474 RepID=A0A0G4I8D7_9ALVE|eukprot:Cvel_11901.t1-p1 / transcript=Cvel_11901.t1 / gene=Cvel_11901 / organism=Chromera_velia_CCMP2878 / gene_product=hypothetical protein / transcript_product=hypothetical protein / location=Cvel_scaffold761:55859-57587(+) / protein_length=138 / sequence_SO=supercontig / SO=protein_coding / is_pseudo=false
MQHQELTRTALSLSAGATTSSAVTTTLRASAVTATNLLWPTTGPITRGPLHFKGAPPLAHVSTPIHRFDAAARRATASLARTEGHKGGKERPGRVERRGGLRRQRCWEGRRGGVAVGLLSASAAPYWTWRMDMKTGGL